MRFNSKNKTGKIVNYWNKCIDLQTIIWFMLEFFYSKTIEILNRIKFRYISNFLIFIYYFKKYAKISVTILLKIKKQTNKPDRYNYVKLHNCFCGQKLQHIIAVRIMYNICCINWLSKAFLTNAQCCKPKLNKEIKIII